MRVTWLTHMWEMTHAYVWHDPSIFPILLHSLTFTRNRVWFDPFLRVTWLTHMCDMTHVYYRTCSYVFTHDPFMYVTWLFYMPNMIPLIYFPKSTFHPNHNRLWLISICDMTHSCIYVWRDSFMCVTWLTHMCDLTHWCVWNDSFIRVTWLVHTCDTTHSYVWHDCFICGITPEPSNWDCSHVSSNTLQLTATHCSTQSIGASNYNYSQVSGRASYHMWYSYHMCIYHMSTYVTLAIYHISTCATTCPHVWATRCAYTTCAYTTRVNIALYIAP